MFLVTLGSAAEHGARVGFVANLFVAGGIQVVTATSITGSTDVLAAFRDNGLAIACIVGTDQSYAEVGAEMAAAVRAAGASRVLLAGRPTGKIADLIDDHIAAGDDVLKFLRRTRRHLLEMEARK